MAIVYGTTFSVAGLLAFGLTYFDRGDAREIQWGRWALYTATHGFVIACVVLKFSREFVDAIVGFLLGTGSAVFLLAAVFSPFGNGGNSENATILMVVLSALCCVGVLLHLLALTFQWRWFLFFPRPDRSQGMANVMNRFWYGVTAFAVALGLSLYTILFSLGPEAWKIYGEQKQIYLTVLLADGLVKGLVLPLVYFLLNGDGEPSDRSAYSVFTSRPEFMQPQQPVQSQMGYASAVDNMVL